MIKEFALEPEFIAGSYERFIYIIEKFGISQGRVISRFPKTWKRMVYEAAQGSLKGTAALSRIEIKLGTIGDDVLFPSGRPGGDGSKPWIDRAINEHNREPFTAIISVNPNVNPAVVSSDVLDGDHPHFKPNQQWKIKRASKELIDCSDLLLRQCKLVKLVDPHFELRFGDDRWKRPLMQLLSRLPEYPITIEIHRCDNKLDSYFISQFDKIFPSILTKNLTVKVFIHPENLDPKHNRFIMTDLGGLIYPVGLDDNEDGGHTSEDVVILMSSEIYKLTWDEYSNARLMGEWTSN